MSRTSEIVNGTWDVALSKAGRPGDGALLSLRLPSPISRSMIARGLLRAELSITPEGLLLKPYAAPDSSRPRNQTVELPEDWA